MTKEIDAEEGSTMTTTSTEPRADTGAAADDDSTGAAPETESSAGRTESRNEGRGIAGYTVSVKTLALAAVILGLVIALIATTWMLVDRSGQLDAIHAQQANEARAEQIATDYSVGAAAMDFTKTAEWKGRLTKGTSPELAKRLTDAATSMEQITAPLQWTSTSTPINATIRSADDGKYVVDCFVSVLTKNTQAPEGVQSTATYSVTIDSNNDWLITDVGGIGAMLGSN
ncbi:hypothetical protein [Gordonia rubripertincta]|uniref:hypothetical protein n=1 Tax=Gordonia rubripertincta TaxID=36822 RepID=UPI000B8D1D7C|nr:hypothetical protein [Gordonia rubripertincta]ASR01216.1 hypothetical protein GCWB2_01930 [Gordonia rubripertincta]